MNPILKRTLTGLAVGAVVICAVLFVPRRVLEFVVIVLSLLAFWEYSSLLEIKTRAQGKKLGSMWCLVLLGFALIFAGIGMLAEIADVHGDEMCGPFRLGNVMLLYVIAIVKFSDVGGFAFGLTSAKLMKGGNHKLCPTISPNKSWEGLFGSIFASCLVSCSFMGATGFGVVKSLACGVAAALVGTAGDLVESKFKRWVGVKDSSTMKITNGMGGFLDMVDSLLFAPAVLYFLMGLDF